VELGLLVALVVVAWVAFDMLQTGFLKGSFAADFRGAV